MITEPEFYNVLAKHPNVEAAFEKAVNTMTKMAKEAEKPGIWAKLATGRLAFDNASAMKELLTNYGLATGRPRDASDVDYIEKIIFMAARDPNRRILLSLMADTGAMR